MSNNYFKFKQFTIFHDKCAMKVTTDSVMLGAWADVNGVNYALDIGTGTGLLALMIAQRTNAIIDAIEIDESACMQASENVSNSPWKKKIKIIHDTIQHFAYLTDKTYDMIISNPPYFQHSLKPPDKLRSAARHTTSLSYDELLINTQKLLAPKGKFSVIIPAVESENFTELAHIYQLYPSRITRIKPFPYANYTRVMIEFCFKKVNNILQNDLIIHNAIGKYAEEYIQLTKDFYLKFNY
jgi:tRNA1Val (adenine37-N6)-methyltransferase